MGEGQTFLSDYVETSDGEKRHLMIVIKEKDGQYLVVPVTSWRSDFQRIKRQEEFILNAGDHRFIKHKSWIDFSRADEKSAVEVFNGIRKGFLIPMDDIKKDLLVLIQAKAEISDYLPEKFLAFFE